MDRVDRVARDAILQKVFPDLRYGDDPDIGRYFELRKAGRVAEALSIYNRDLRARYPDDAERVVLLNLYRRNDPRFPSFHDRLLWNLYDSVAVRLHANLDALCEPLIGTPLKNTYGVLKAMESVVGMLPPGSHAALNFLDSYVSYAGLLEYREAEVRRIRFLAGEYFAQATDRAPEATDFLARSFEAEERRKKRRQAERNFFDLSKIVFSEADLRRIEIPRNLERKEDRVLAFCVKYWLCVNDPTLERATFLYSRKFGTPHYDVFRAIKTGRARKFTDDEILNRVSTVLSSRYSYSVQGDLYMQRAWRRIKARLLGLEKKENSPEPEGDKKSPRGNAGGRRRRKASGSRRPRSAGPAGRKRKKTAKLSGGPERPLRRVPAGKPRSLAPRTRPEAVAALAPRGSVSDLIKRLSGRSYDVYREEFLSRVRPCIRAWLIEHDTRPKATPTETEERAEDLIHEFLTKNYSNPYMDWESSESRKDVEGMGFSVPNLDGIVRLWYTKR